MKKRLLITSIVMMLVVAVALSTATYAWFTSNTSVTANTINLTASTSDAAAFGISWTNGSYNSSLASITGPATTFNPLVPAAYSAGTTATDVIFYTATMRQEGGAEKYNGDVKWWNTTEETTPSGAGGANAAGYNTAAKPYIWNDGTHYSFFIKNLSTANSQDHLYASASVTGAADSMVRIAIFADGTLKGILGYDYTYTAVGDGTFSNSTAYYRHVTNGYLVDTTITADNFDANKASLYTRSAQPKVADTYYGTIEADANVLTQKANSSLSVDLGSFAAEGYKEITVYVWLDGKFLDDDTDTTAASIDLRFDVTNPYAA